MKSFPKHYSHELRTIKPLIVAEYESKFCELFKKWSLKRTWMEFYQNISRRIFKCLKNLWVLSAWDLGVKVCLWQVAVDQPYPRTAPKWHEFTTSQRNSGNFSTCLIISGGKIVPLSRDMLLMFINEHLYSLVPPELSNAWGILMAHPGASCQDFILEQQSYWKFPSSLGQEKEAWDNWLLID